MKSIFFKYFFIATMLLPAVFAQQSSDKPGFSLYYHTQGVDGVGANILANAGVVKFEELGEFLSNSKDAEGNSVLPNAHEPIEIVIVVPKGAPRVYRDEFKNAVERQMKKLYPGGVYKLKESFINVAEDTRELLEAKDYIAALQKNFSPATEEYKLAQAEVNELEKARLELQNWEKSWLSKSLEWTRNRSPLNRMMAAKIVAGLKGSISFSVYLTRYGVSFSSFVVSLFGGGVAAAFGFMAREWQKFCTDHNFPGSKRFDKVRNNFIVERYNNSPFLKSANVNLFRSVVIGYLLRLSAYATGQTVPKLSDEGVDTGEREPVSTPNEWDFFKGLFGIGLIEIAADAAMDVGVKGMIHKGYMNYQSSSYFNWAVSFVDITMHALYRSGRPHLAYGLTALGTVIKLATWRIGKALKHKQKKIIFISDQVSPKSEDFLNLKRDLNLSESWKLHFPPEEVVRAREDIPSKEFLDILQMPEIDSVAFNYLHNEKIAQGKDFDIRQSCQNALMALKKVRAK